MPATQTSSLAGSYPILACEEATAFEESLFGGDEAREWSAMQSAGQAVADAIVIDFAEIGPWPKSARVLVLAGKGHNAGDALLAAAALRKRFLPSVIAVDVIWTVDRPTARLLARRAGDILEASGQVLCLETADVLTADAAARAYDVVIDGVFGCRFRAPLAAPVAAVLAKINTWPIRLRAAVDLPSGLDEEDAFRAHFTYATGIVKTPLLTTVNAGRVRFLDLGFPLDKWRTASSTNERGLGTKILDDLRTPRAARSDKRSFGHVLIVAGSRRYPGAALMATLAALRGGAGLVTTAVPESLVPAFAAAAPEAIWVGLPETPDGGLALEGLGAVRAAFARASAVVVGSGIGREPETLALVKAITAASPHPLVIDADALRPEIVAAGDAARILTPHAGEWERIAGAARPGAVVVRKGPISRVEVTGTKGGAGDGDAPVYHSFFGGPVLARGGSGDLLAGLTGTCLAQTPGDALGAAARALVWHGQAADLLTQARGATAVRTTDLLDFLGPVLREAKPEKTLAP